MRSQQVKEDSCCVAHAYTKIVTDSIARSCTIKYIYSINFEALVLHEHFIVWFLFGCLIRLKNNLNLIYLSYCAKYFLVLYIYMGIAIGW